MPRCKLTSSEVELPFGLTWRHFPVVPCFAMAINKAQGQTLARVGIFLRRPEYSQGQLYVTVPRATSRQNLRFMIIEGSSTLPDGSQETCTTNTVYGRGAQRLRATATKDSTRVAAGMLKSEGMEKGARCRGVATPEALLGRCPLSVADLHYAWAGFVLCVECC